MSAMTLGALQAALNYDVATGVFTRRSSRFAPQNIGRVAGTVRKDGYIEIRVGGAPHLAHRLAWFWGHGEWPVAQIDHINGRKADNRMANLREATHAQNQKNRRAPRANNSSGFKGVTFDKQTNMWRAQIGDGRRHYVLGRFATRESAATAYDAASKRLHKDFAAPNDLCALAGIPQASAEG